MPKSPNLPVVRTMNRKEKEDFLVKLNTIMAERRHESVDVASAIGCHRQVVDTWLKGFGFPTSRMINKVIDLYFTQSMEEEVESEPEIQNPPEIVLAILSALDNITKRLDRSEKMLIEMHREFVSLKSIQTPIDEPLVEISGGILEGAA